MKTNHKHSLAVILWIICVQLFSYSNLTAQTVGFSVASKNPVENDTFNVAVRADSVLTGRGIYAFKLGLNYNSNYLEYLGIDSVGTVMKSWSIPTVNSQAAGTLVIAGAGASALMGKGNMFYLRFRAIQGGYTYIQNISSVSYLNEGSPVMSLNYGIINCSSIPKPDIYPDYQTLFVGETMQLYGYSGTPPYIFQTVNTAVATTTSAGLVTAVGPGTTQAFVTDSKGYKNYTYGNIDVRAVKLSVISTNTSPQDSFYLPIKIEIAPGTMIYSGSFELAFNSSLEGIKAAAITGDYNISVQNNAQANLVKVSFASGTGITGTGILCKVYMKAINSGVNSVNIQNVLCNETLLALTYSGNVTTECKPCVKATGLLPENGKQNLNSTVDLYWQPALNAKYYSLYLWEQGTTMPTSPYYSYIYGTSTWLYNLAPGKTFNWKLVSVNECSTAESDVQSFSVRPIPDLTVTDVQMPASVESGSAFTLTFTVKNIGQTTTGSSLWTDAVYMSTDSTGNSGMNYMVAKYNMGPLAVNGTYTQSYPVSVPAEYSGKYYLWVRADNSGSVTELSENNNQLRAINPITVELKPFPDILVKDIAASATATPGDSLQITWKVGNIGNASALGGWTERISLISNSGVRAYLNPTYITVTRDLAVGETITRTAKIKLPEVPRFSGNAKVEIELFPSSTLIEHSGNDANNKAASANYVNVSKRLFLEIATGSLIESSTDDVRCIVTRSGEYDADMTANVTVAPTGQITIPATVTIPANNSSAVFYLKAIDNLLVDGTRNVSISVAASGFGGDTTRLQITDNEATVITAKLNKKTAVEGDNLQLTITRNLVTSSPLTLALSTDKPSQWSFDNHAEIPANQASIVVPVYVTDDQVAELNGNAILTASAYGYVSGKDTAFIIDNDLPEVEFKLLMDTVQESAGIYATYGVIKRVKGDGMIIVNLTPSLSNTLILPGSISLNKGVSEAKFNIGVIDNNLVDGNRKVTIKGSIYLSSCSCNTSAENGGIVQQDLVVVDNDGPSLSASANPASLYEGKVNAGTLTISRNTPPTNDLPITIKYNDPTEVSMQTSAVIPAGQTSVSVPISTLNDGVQDGNQMVTFEVSTPGYASGYCYLYVTDLNKPDYAFSRVALSQSKAVTDSAIQISGYLQNVGYLNAPPGTIVNFYLSKDDYVDGNDDLLGYYTAPNGIPTGDSLRFVFNLKMPGKTGTYKIIAKANPDNIVTELVYTNNTSQPLAIEIAPEYSATAIVDQTVFLQNLPVTIHGTATKLNAQPAANVNVDVYLLCNGTRRQLSATTNNQGNYQIQFSPLFNEAGHFSVGACYPGQGLSVEQDAFDILGMKRATSDYLIWVTKKNLSLTGTIQINNSSNVALTNLIVKPDFLPAGCTMTFDTVKVLQGAGSVQINFTVKGTEITTGKDYKKIYLTIESNEGASTQFPAYYYCQAVEAQLNALPVSINTTMTKDKSRYYELSVYNSGAGEAGKTWITLPNVSYMSLVSSDTISNIQPWDTVKVTLKLTPTDVPLNTPITGNIAVNCSNGPGLSIPYKLEAVSEATGSLKVDAVDEYTYFTEKAPHLSGAHVVVRHPFSGVILAEGFTDTLGIFSVPSLPEGNYRLTVEATKHDTYQNIVTIDPGRENTATAYLSFQAITYTWEVVPTEIQDQYKIDLIMQYETSVPVPVVVIEMPSEMPKLVNDETYTFMVTLTNKGLITATDVQLNFPNDPEYEFVTNFTTMNLLAQQSIQVPVVMKRRASYSPNPVSGLRSAESTEEALNCHDVVYTIYGFQCGPDKKWHRSDKGITFTGRVCDYTGSISLPGGGGPVGDPSYGGGGGWPTGASGGVIPVTAPTAECDNCLMSLGLTAVGCIPALGPVITNGSGIIGCLLSLADMDIALKDVADCAMTAAGLVIDLSEIGCLYGLIRTAWECYQDPPVFVKSAMVVDDINAMTNAAALQKMPPILKQSMQDLTYYIYGYEALDSISGEMMGKWDWRSRVNTHDFINAVDSFIRQTRSFLPEDISRINQKMQGTDITSDDVDRFTSRWNNSLIAWNKQIFSPNDQYPDIIDKVKLKGYISKLDSASRYANKRGYEGIFDMLSDAWTTTQDQIESGRKSVCASVTIQISQKLTMTREAFDGTLTISNGNTTTSMKEVKLNLEVKDENGNLANDLFQINTKALDILTGIDGTGELGAGQKGSATIQFIPEKGAAPTVAKSYSFGGSFSYLDPFSGTTVTRVLYPVTLEVHPSPDLWLHYFMQRDILGDDPLTPTIEPIVPAELALMIQNNGYGTAKSVKVESAQPVIVDNEKGLAIKFALIASNLNGQERQLGVTNIDFGNIAPKSTAIGEWWFTSNLLGHFVSYETKLTHLNSFGNPDLSLVSGATLHELIKNIRVYTMEDGINDFLVNEVQDASETPDIIYLSNGTTLDVHPAKSVSITGSIKGTNFEGELTVTPFLLGWNYAKISDPTGGRYKLVSVIRESDNQIIPLDNVWQTFVTLPDGKDPVYENMLHFVDDFSAISPVKYKLLFALKEQNPPKVMKVEGVPATVTTTSVTTVTVTFNKPIDPATFTYEDMNLSLQGGDNIMDNTVTVTQTDPTTFVVDLTTKTIGDGFYVLTIQAAGIRDTSGVSGTEGFQTGWTQYAHTPAIVEFAGLPDNGVGAPIDYLFVRFTVPINTSTLTADRFTWTKDGVPVTGSVTITTMDTQSKLFKISGLSSFLSADATYKLTVDLTQIKSQDNVYGVLPQSVQWRVDTHAPAILQILRRSTGGFDAQHATEIEVRFTEPVIGFGLSSIELWKDGVRQPLSQLNLTQVNSKTFLFTQFRLLTYYEGNYILKVKMDGIADSAGNVASGTVEQKWTVNRTAPLAVTDLHITPDMGYSATDAITATPNLSVVMTVNAPKSRIQLYQNSYSTLTLLTDTANVGKGQLTLPVSLSNSGNMVLEVYCLDTLSNQSITTLDVSIDNIVLSAQWTNVPTTSQVLQPDSLVLEFSDKLLADDQLKQYLTLKANGVSVSTAPLSIVKISDKVYAVKGIRQAVQGVGGTYSLTADLTALRKYLSGKEGAVSAIAEWIIQPNKAPVANAGPDQTVNEGDLVTLNGAASTDPDGDTFTYKWTAPAGITLSAANVAKPIFTAPQVDKDTEFTFTLVVNDGKADSPADPITVWVKNSGGSGVPYVKTDSKRVSLYPNPTKGIVYVTINEPFAEGYIVMVNDSRGQAVQIMAKDKSVTRFSIDIGQCVTGVYTISVIAKDGTSTTKVIKE